MGYKLFVKLRTYNELRGRLAGVPMSVYLDGVDQEVGAVTSDGNGDADVTIDRSDDTADVPPLAYCYANKAGFYLAAAWLDVNPQGFYSGDEAVKTFWVDGSFILIGDAQTPPPPPPPPSCPAGMYFDQALNQCVPTQPGPFQP